MSWKSVLSKVLLFGFLFARSRSAKVRRVQGRITNWLEIAREVVDYVNDHPEVTWLDVLREFGLTPDEGYILHGYLLKETPVLAAQIVNPVDVDPEDSQV
jgi:hypothetical protein